jgi:hypothetical protein
VRVTTARPELEVAPGETASLVVDVVNTNQVIDGVSARVIGLPEESVRCEPSLLPLFPEASGALTVSISPPRHMVAGRHPIAIEVTSHGAQAPTQYIEIVLIVAPDPQLQLASRPRIAKGRRHGRFVLEVINPGNVRLQVDLEATDPDRQMGYRFSPNRVVVPPGRATAAVLHVRARRRISGGVLDRNINVRASGERMDLPIDWRDPEAEPLVDQVQLQLRQPPLIARGLMTALILMSIVGLWAAAFLFGLAKVFASNPPTKQAPASFFWLKGVTRVGNAVNAAFDLNQGTIPGTLPKTGELPPGTGSQITGTVLGWVDNQPVGRILVEAYRLKNGTTPYPVSSAGTQTDGTFALAGLFPTSYYLKFSASGYRSVWYSGASYGSATLRGAALVQTRVQAAVSLPSLVIRGRPATIRGGVNPGDTTSPVDVTVTAQLMVGDVPQSAKVKTVHTDPATNKYVLTGLRAPASYEITFTADGYQSSAIVEAVGGGDDRFEPPIALSAGQGQINGRVTDAVGNPLGGVTVSTVVNGAPVTVMTPTVGTLGVYSLQNLPTPGTYVVTFTSPNYGTKTKIVNLGVGLAASKPLNVKLVAGTGSVTGVVRGPDGNGLGGASVTVGGTSVSGIVGATPSTTTLTDGARGNFVINGLVAPGSYTLTAQLPGYLPATVAFDLNGATVLRSITIVLSRNTASISGKVSGSCPETACVNAVVTATNGQQTWNTGVSSAGGALPSGGYLFRDLPPGTYTLTVTDAGMRQQTAIITIYARTKPFDQPLTLKPAAN